MPQAHPQHAKSAKRSELVMVMLMGCTSVIGLLLFALFRLHRG
ncbi:unnamed protein product [Acidocella sp. C78]|nr:hypothetical protein [Acidocella sp. C78]CAG4924468.1 unnamed protein product [Acidocella sp. C78]